MNCLMGLLRLKVRGGVINHRFLQIALKVGLGGLAKNDVFNQNKAILDRISSNVDRQTRSRKY